MLKYGIDGLKVLIDACNAVDNELKGMNIQMREGMEMVKLWPSIPLASLPRTAESLHKGKKVVIYLLTYSPLEAHSKENWVSFNVGSSK